MKKQNVLCILDGYGISEEKEGNAIYLAATPVMDMLKEKYPYVKGNASGLFVGLPSGQMGNSEVGHLNIGAGRVVFQELTRITRDIENGSFFENKELIEAIKNVKANNSSLHIMGLVSNGGVHSHNTHLYALLELAKRNNLKKVFIHCFLDGRDTPPDSAKLFLEELENVIKEKNVSCIASICGRYYAMDRDKNYDRTKKTYDLISNRVGNKFKTSCDAIIASYNNKIFDEFVEPSCIDVSMKGFDENDAKIKNNDSVIFFNFRPDRARQITRCFCDDEFGYFKRNENNDRIKTTFVCFTDYDETITNKLVAFKKEEIVNTLGEVIANNNMTQLRTAETEKYAHVTFFMNGGNEVPYKNEDRILIPSPKDVPTYDLKPQMSAYEVCDTVVNAIKEQKYDLIIVNFANSDMVGHTGVLEAAIKAVEVVDECVGKIYDEIKKLNGNMLIIADHGNSDKMIDKNGKPYTAHTTNLVPFILISNDNYKLKEGGALSDIAPTLLQLMNIEKPKEMTGHSLLI